MISALKRLNYIPLLGMLLLFANSQTAAKEPTERILKIAPAKGKIKLNHFHITKVVDNRKDKRSIGYITTGLFNYFVPAYFANKTEEEINKYIQENTIQYSSTEPVTLQINEYFVHEKTSFKGAEIGLRTNYTLYNKNGIRLWDYAKLESRNTGMNMSSYASALLRQNIVDFLGSADKAMVPILASLKNEQKLQVQHIISRIGDDKSIKIYDPQFPLNKFNYVGKVPSNPTKDVHSASGLNVSHVIQLVNGKPEVTIELEPYFDQSKSWIKPSKIDAYRMEYEQTYFKIAAYVTHHFIKEIENKTFTLATIDNDIASMTAQYQAELASLQQQFREETKEGADTLAFENWKRKVAFYPNLAIR